MATEDSKEHQEGLAAARRTAGYRIGDPSWADLIIEAYLDPEGAHRDLDTEGADPR